MLNAAIVEKSKHSGHDSCPPMPMITGSSDVFINNLAVGIATVSLFGEHGCDSHSPHKDVLVTGSPDTFVNDLPMGRLTDKTDWGATIISGSDDTFIN